MDRLNRRISDLVSRLSPRRRGHRGHRGADGHRMAGTVEYTPHLDGRADPGEVVWTWVPYEDDPNRGKDRPVLIIGRRGDTLRCLPLTSKDHERDAAQEASVGRQRVQCGCCSNGTFLHQNRRAAARTFHLAPTLWLMWPVLPSPQPSWSSTKHQRHASPGSKLRMTG